GAIRISLRRIVRAVSLQDARLRHHSAARRAQCFDGAAARPISDARRPTTSAVSHSLLTLKTFRPKKGEEKRSYVSSRNFRGSAQAPTAEEFYTKVYLQPGSQSHWHSVHAAGYDFCAVRRGHVRA